MKTEKNTFYCSNCKTVYTHEICCPFCDYDNDKNEEVERIMINKEQTK
jgi:hypothetical protein